MDCVHFQNMMALLLATTYFASTWIGGSLHQNTLVNNITRVSKRFLGVTKFHYYVTLSTAAPDSSTGMVNGAGLIKTHILHSHLNFPYHWIFEIIF